MKYFLLLLAVIVAACSVPPPNPVRVETPISLEVVITAPKEELKEAPKPKPKAEKTMPHCKGIDAGDLNNTINQKIDCLLNETAK